MNEQLVLFEGQEEVKVRTDKGETLINLANTGKICGLTIIDKKRGTIRVAWKGKGSLFEKLTKILNNLEKSKCEGISSQDNYQKYIDEINYILKEIEESDDRNSIYMSSWSTRRLAMNCNSEKAERYKNYLATLDEKYSNGQLIQGNFDLNQFNTMTQQMVNMTSMVSSTMNQIGQAFRGVQEYVQNSIQAKDAQINYIENLIGVRDVNVKKLSKRLKEKVEDKYHKKVWSTSREYKQTKEELFKRFDVTAWEQIPVVQYTNVSDYIKEL